MNPNESVSKIVVFEVIIRENWLKIEELEKCNLAVGWDFKNIPNHVYIYLRDSKQSNFQSKPKFTLAVIEIQCAPLMVGGGENSKIC